MKVSFKRKIVVKFKKNISKIVLFFLYRGFKVLYKYDKNLKYELDNLESLLNIKLQLQKNDYCLNIIKENSDIKKIEFFNMKNNKYIDNRVFNNYIFNNQNSDCDILICFKSLDAAFSVLTGRVGISKAYAMHSFTLKGDISKAMALVRCINIIEAYLFPKFMTKKILKEIPKKKFNILITYFHVLFDNDFIYKTYKVFKNIIYKNKKVESKI